jgi:hypothetical protein
LITVKEEFLGSVKTKRAMKLGGSDSVVLWLALKGYVAASNSGGFIPAEAVPDLEGVPRNWRKVMRALVDCGKLKPDGTRGTGLVYEVEHGYQLHDYEDHGTPVDVEERRRKAREQKRRRRAEIATGKEPCPSDRTGQRPDNKTGQRDRTGNGQKPYVPPGAPGRRCDPQPSPALKEDPPTPFPDKPVDAFTASLANQLPHDRVDVNKLHEAYKRTFDLPHRTWFPGNLHEARIMAEAIDAHGLDKCLLVLAEAPNDGMVSGRDDEKKAKHESVSYIFGNSSAFDRMLRAAAKRAEQTGNGQSIAQKMAELKDRRVS